MLTIINDGNGSQCGFTYKQRCELARMFAHGLLKFREMARNYNRYAVKNYGSPRATREECTEAGNRLFHYYEEHIKE
jgi:hypothetical protein